MNELSHDEVSIHVDADPLAVYELVADVTRSPEWSPELVRCTWLGGATGPQVGARFRAVNTLGHGPTWSNKPTVITAEPGREFAVSRVEAIGGELIWRYRLEPDATGTTVRNSYEVVRQPTWLLRHVIMRRIYGTTDRATEIRTTMQTTLQRLKETAEANGTGTPHATN